MGKTFSKSDHTTPHDHTENLMPALTARVSSCTRLHAGLPYSGKSEMRCPQTRAPSTPLHKNPHCAVVWCGVDRKDFVLLNKILQPSLLFVKTFGKTDHTTPQWESDVRLVARNRVGSRVGCSPVRVTPGAARGYTRLRAGLRCSGKSDPPLAARNRSSQSDVVGFP